MTHSALLSFQQAKQILLDGTTSITEAQKVPLNRALERVLSADVIAPINVPQHDNSAMDGYALAFKGDKVGPNATFTFVGKSLAGNPFDGELNPGQSVRITTGGVVPKGTDAVVMQENVERVVSFQRFKSWLVNHVTWFKSWMETYTVIFFIHVGFLYLLLWALCVRINEHFLSKEISPLLIDLEKLKANF